MIERVKCFAKVKLAVQYRVRGEWSLREWWEVAWRQTNSIARENLFDEDGCLRLDKRCSHASARLPWKVMERAAQRSAKETLLELRLRILSIAPQNHDYHRFYTN